MKKIVQMIKALRLKSGAAWLRSHWRLWGGGILGGALLAVGITVLMHKEPTFFARTSQGIVQGAMVEGVNAFLGIPYARPPVEELRWMPPRHPKKWQGVLAADQVPPHCVQSIFGFVRGQEDCLYLNVWTPNLFPEKPLPVMVWIHGGGFTVGHSYETTPAQRLAKNGDVIIVSMNYRLGALGFMAHPELTSQNNLNTSGNYGLLDQVFALQWVRRNIKNFGGDPNNITIFGQSAGGMSVCNLLASPLAKDLFHKAIIQSGPCYSPYPELNFVEQQGLTMQERLGCDAAENKTACMRSKTAEDIMAAMPPPPGMVFGEEDEFWMPNIDGKALNEQVFKSFENGNFHKVPVINGNNADEGTLLVMFGHEYQMRSVTPSVYPERIEYLVRNKDKALQVMKQYPLEKYPDAGEALSSLFGDMHFVCHERWTSDALSKQVPTYSYYFSYADADFILPELRDLRAFHGAESQFIFNDSMAWFERRLSGREKELSERMMNYWVQFARSGNPNGEADAAQMAFEWPAYQTGQQRLQLDTTLSLKSGRDTDEVCQFWKDLATEKFVP